MATETVKHSIERSLDPKSHPNEQLSKEKTEITRRKKSLISRIATFTKSKVNTISHHRSLSEGIQRSPKIVIGEPILEHASVPICEEEYNELSHRSSFRRKPGGRNASLNNIHTSLNFEKCSNDILDVASGLKDFNVKQQSSSKHIAGKEHREECSTVSITPETDIGDFCGVATPEQESIEFLPKLSDQTSIAQSFRYSVLVNDFDPIFANVSDSTTSIEKLQASFDERKSKFALDNRSCSVIDSFYSVEESVSALNDLTTYANVSHNNALGKPETSDKVFDLPPLDVIASENSLTTQSELSGSVPTVSSNNMTMESTTNTLCTLISEYNEGLKQNNLNESPSLEDFIFEYSDNDSKLRRKNSTFEFSPRYPNLAAVTVKGELESLPKAVNRSDNTVSAASISHAQRNALLLHKGGSYMQWSNPTDTTNTSMSTDLNSNQTRRVSSSDIDLLDSKIAYLEACEKNNWRQIITGLPRILPINYYGRDEFHLMQAHTTYQDWE